MVNNGIKYLLNILNRPLDGNADRYIIQLTEVNIASDSLFTLLAIYLSI